MRESTLIQDGGGEKLEEAIYDGKYKQTRYIRKIHTGGNNEQLELIAELLRGLSQKLDAVLNALESIDHGVHN